MNGARVGFCFRGEFIDAVEAGRIGLVNRVVQDTELQQASHSTAAVVARHSRVALRRTKQLIRSDTQEILRAERESLLEHFRKRDRICKLFRQDLNRKRH